MRSFPIVLGWCVGLAVLASVGIQRAAAQQATGQQAATRPLAPGVMQTVEPDQEYEETFSRHDIPELLAVNPNWKWAADVDFRHPIWTLAFAYKPVRMIAVDLPQPSGMMQRKLIWYMVYTVTNNGQTVVPVLDQDLPYQPKDNAKTVRIEKRDEPVRFIPEFLLEGYNHLKDGDGWVKAYPDRVIPLAIDAIQQREDPNRKLLSTVEMCREIPVGQTLWGVATWEDVDPKIVRFSVYVKGLSNAYRWKDDPAEVQAGGQVGAGRRFAVKTLKMNFWRPGDDIDPNEGEIRLGIPGGVDYEWVYR